MIQCLLTFIIQFRCLIKKNYIQKKYPDNMLFCYENLEFIFDNGYNLWHYNLSNWLITVHKVLNFWLSWPSKVTFIEMLINDVNGEVRFDLISAFLSRSTVIQHSLHMTSDLFLSTQVVCSICKSYAISQFVRVTIFLNLSVFLLPVISNFGFRILIPYFHSQYEVNTKSLIVNTLKTYNAELVKKKY